MGYMMVLGECWVCKRHFSFNADWVPSFQGEPVCETCMEVVNERRAEMGEDPFPVHPMAYEAQEVM